MLRKTFIIAALTIFSVGCASAPQSLVDARAAYEQAEQTNAPQYAPSELREAKQALDAAERAFDKEGKGETTDTFAYVAQRRAKMAEVAGAFYAAKRERDAKEDVLMRQNEQARDILTSKLEEKSEYAQMTRQELANERERLESAKSELATARLEGELTEDQLREKEAKLASMSTELKAEREARKRAQENLEETKEELAKVASIKEEQKRMVITLNGSVLFEVDKAQLRPVAERRLDQVADVLLAEREAEITVEGHTDSQGKSSYNDKLSRERAQSVRQYLVGQGIASDRIAAIGKGESDPIATNDTPEGRANNRRVEIVVDRQTAQGG